jgi:hypothetical protein
MYYWMREKLGDHWLTRLLAIAVYSALVFLIILYSTFPGDTFRYLDM